MQVALPWMAIGLCLFCGTVAVFLRPAAFAAWLFFLGMALLAGEGWLDHQVDLAAGTPELSTWLRRSLLLKSGIPAVWLGFSLVYARGDSGGFLRRWKWILLASFLIPAAMLLGFPESLHGEVGRDGGVTMRFQQAGKTWVITLLVITLLTLINLEKTFRTSVGMTRWRIKYLILGVTLVFGVRVYSLSQMLLYSSYDFESANLTSVSLLLGCGLIGIGQLRSCFGEFDIYPSRAVLQGSVTVILVGVYFIVVGILAQWVAIVGGKANFPAQALVLLLGAVGLTVICLSERFRTFLQRFTSRHFRRPEHDFRKIWTDFTRRTSSVLDPTALAKNAAELVSESFHVLGVTVFRVASNPPGLELLHSTERRGAIVGPLLAPDHLAGLSRRGQPFILEQENEAWAETLCDCCPTNFGHGGARLVVPLVAAERLMGVMILTDRVNGLPYSHEESDLLKCIGDQLAGALLNGLLTDEVLQAKELEAFQTLSTFFVHDLKNAANGLSLMLQNLPTHFDDPEFRADAMRGVGRTVDRINRMILKLGSLRRELQLNAKPCRLDLLCAEILDGFESGMSGSRRLKRDLLPVPEQIIDEEAMRSVVTNLVSNAQESLNGHGEVKVSTRMDLLGVELVVADDGCGMSPEFVKTLLFRPFHTTKTNGLGIGMFQCKKIIEAHGGRILVDSQPGKGSSFTVFVPFALNLQSERLPS